jgi:hypothetical protein
MRGYDWGFGFGFGDRHPAWRRGYDARGGYGGRPGGGPPGRVFERGSVGGGSAGRGQDRGGGAPAGYDRGYGWHARGGHAGDRQRGYSERGFVPRSAYDRGLHFEDPWDRVPEGFTGYTSFEETDDDVELEQAIRVNLYQDTWIDADRIEVEVEDGVVILRGEVDDHMQSRYAWDDAWETDGVRGVLNQLTVREETAEEGEPAEETTDKGAAGGKAGAKKSKQG